MSVSAAPETRSASCHALLDALEAEGAAAFGNRERIDAACAALRDLRLECTGTTLAARLPRLAQLVSRRVAEVNAPIVRLLCEIAGTLNDPWPPLEPLLDSHDARVIATVLDTLGRIAAERPSFIDERVLHGLAARVDLEGGPLSERVTLETLANLLRAPPPGDSGGLESLCAGRAGMPVRRLAARLLDLRPSPPSAELPAQILGPDMAAWLAPYLVWTRATHLDLLALASGAPTAALAALRSAEEICGPKLLREIVGEIGWPRLNFGLTIRRFSGISVDGSFPLLVAPVEAQLLEDAPDPDPQIRTVPTHRRLFDRLLVVAHGGEAQETASPLDAVIARFRAYNIAHAELLAGFLDVTPLTTDKVRTTIERMDRIVEDFQSLFASHTDECPMLGEVYGGLKAAIQRSLATESGEPGTPVSAELTRLVEMFDDPGSLTAVRTLHGLKRYLHQRGLKLGMRLAEAGRSANRTVTLVLATPERVLQTSHAVEYVDFEPPPSGDDAPPYAVRLVADEFGRQMVHAEQPPPKVKIFCYGNEVHYFIAYRNHPAFVRIDYSAPGRGGMIDLAYFGVSKYELSAHPAPSLPAVERFFRRLDFDIHIENTHVHARYDKERAFDLADLCGKAASLFRLAPYLMDVDWVIGDLALSSDARGEVATAWAEFFAAWGVLPYQQFLTADRCGILAGIESAPAGERELRWSGVGPYRDRFSSGAPGDFWERVRIAADARMLRHVVPFDGDGPVAQLLFEDRVVRPLRDACVRGEIMADGDVRVESPERFARRHPAECLVGVLQANTETIARSARLASLVAMLARGLRFQTVGAINGFDVQCASLPLPGRTLGLYGLRDASGIFRLALFAPGDALFVRRESTERAWRENWSLDAESLVSLLRRANYATPQLEPSADDAGASASRIVELFQSENRHASLPPLAGERIVSGTTASPGRAVGLARLGLANRHPADVAGAILICPSMSPADGAFLSMSAGVVSTGGGALSHAGLLALQYGKPALIVAGSWQQSDASLPSLAYRTVHYDERHRQIGRYRLTERHHLREREERLYDGDLVVLDADENVLRILGQEPQGLAFHESLRQLGAASAQLAAAASDAEILIERGRQLRARHQLGKVLGRIADPILARHAVTELLLRSAGAAQSVAPSEKGRLLALLLGNPRVGSVAREAVHLAVATLTRRLEADTAEALRLISDSSQAWEILALRIGVLGLAADAVATRELIAASGIAIHGGEEETSRETLEVLEALALERIRTLRAHLAETAGHLSAASEVARLRHLVDELDRMDLVAGTEATGLAAVVRARDVVTRHDEAVQQQIAARHILDATAGGIELRSTAGSKAANLAQVTQLGEGALVPPWFVVTDRAFREALEAPVAHATTPSLHAPSVRVAVEGALARPDLTNAQRASLIRQAWDAAQLPHDIMDAVTRAYHRLTSADGQPADDENPPFVAVRSSASEEDREVATRAGEFDTFLFVRGDDALITHLKRAWSGLWSERALHNRAVLGLGGSVGGGILVQRMIAARASGVLHTVNVAEGRPREMVINAGLGLGEGIVSGAVAADRIIVSKEDGLERGALHFRYLTADKRERVVFNSRLGSGTARVETLYHQRLRPALEYVEICQLVRAAARLEAAYGYPLDIEFAVEGTQLFLLQVRPIPTPFTAWRDTIERWPFARRPAERAVTTPPSAAGLRAQTARGG
jgi:pyruvate,water dikinase